MSASQLTQTQLFAALMRPNVSLAAIEDLLKRDATLSYRVLRCVNSAGFGLKREIGSIRERCCCLASTRSANGRRCGRWRRSIAARRSS